MAEFRYTAKNMKGKTVRGKMEAVNEVTLQQALREQELFLIDAKNLTNSKEYKKLKSKQLASFCKELSTLLAAGVSLVRALDILSEQEGITDNERQLYHAVLQDIKQGISLSEAMETKNIFPDIMLGMIRSGEGSGNLDQVMERLAIQYEKENKLNQQVMSAMTYPMILLVMCGAIVILIVTFILPQFQSLFDMMDELPWITNVLIAFSDFMIHQWYIAALFVFTVFVLIRFILGIPAVRRTIDHLKVKIPMFGPLFKTVYTARFARTISSLYSSGMPIASALDIAGKTVGNIYIEEQFDQSITMVRSGVPLSTALKEIDGFVKKLASTIMVGEESGQLDAMLDSIALTLEDEAEFAMKRMVTLIEPILICFMAVIVGFIMIGVMLPIYQSYSAIESA